ncbi:MAG TPA: IS982 family transposase [Vicinamibacterales bacterium]|nr:IS982 family transposase [Vicinamibacterales bacterium]
MTADLDTLLTALYVLADDLLPRRPRARRRPQITDAELVCLAVAQMLLDCPSERRFLRFARCRLGHLFPYLPKQPGYNKRMRALAPQIVRLLNALAFGSPSWGDNVRLLDSTPVPVGQSRETVKRSEFAGHAGYGYCASHSRWFWGFRLYLLCAPDGMPICFELAPAHVPEREVAAELLRRVQLEGYTVIADKGFSGEDFEQLMAEFRAIFLRPDRKREPARFGNLGGVRQWVESIVDTLKGQLSLERHGAHTMPGLITRIAQRLLALAAVLWHNWNIGDPGRHLTAYDH